MYGAPRGGGYLVIPRGTLTMILFETSWPMRAFICSIIVRGAVTDPCVSPVRSSTSLGVGEGLGIGIIFSLCNDVDMFEMSLEMCGDVSTVPIFLWCAAHR